MDSKIKGASILITGANGGMGLETVKQLLKETPKRIVLACRTKEKAIAAQKEIKKTHQTNTQLEPYGHFDMNKEESIKKAVEALPSQHPFDIIFLQAGGVFFTDDYQFAIHGGQKIEKTTYQNAFGGYLTLKHLSNKGLIAPNARIVYAGGEGARGIKGLIDKPFFKSIQDLKSYLFNGTDSYNPMNAIGVSKLVSALLTMKLSEEDKQREYIWFSPGLTSGTNGLDKMKGLKKVVMKYFAFPVFTVLGLAQSPQKAAAKYVDCLSGRIGESGDVIGAPEGKALGKLVDQKPMNTNLTNHQLRNDLYDLVNELLGAINKIELENNYSTQNK